MPIEVGDLVGFYRRKTPGMGIILDKVDNILEECGIDPYAAFNIAENAQGRTFWEKKEAIKDLSEGDGTANTEFLRLFFQYNESWCRKPKTSFVRIKWFKPPGSYESTLREEEGWYPADWVRSK
jgi:hypothetical protein|tara:strand:+ start:322 stop:693 length:372 start_codon:yes stop_codon:yes gene_type:complete